MNQTTTALAAQPETGQLPVLTLVAVTGSDAVRSALARATADVDGTVEIAYADTASDITTIDTPYPVAAYCLECDADSEAAHRELGLLIGLAAHAPVLLIDSGHAGLDLESAVTEGAADLVPLARESLFAARVRQALRVGRTRLELLEVGQRRNQSPRRPDMLHAGDDTHAPGIDSDCNRALDGRMALHAVLAQTRGRASERVVGLMFVAIDNTAALRAEHGLADSDLLLQEVGLLLLQNTRGEDRIFRFGAGEYVMLVERHSASELGESARQLHASLSSEDFGDSDHGTRLAATIAYATLTSDGDGDADGDDNNHRLHALMDQAYALRDAGGNVCCESAAGEASAGQNAGQSDSNLRQQWITRLQHALAQDRFSLAYQGVTSLAGDSQPYFDVLLRYVDDRGELVRPGEFMPAAEAADLMPDIDRWVTHRAMMVIARQHAKNIDIALFVKLSPATIAAGEAYLTWVEQALQARPVPRGNLIFSFREDDVRNQVEQAGRLATRLEAAKFRVALSHYGSTPKAAQLLEKMPAHFIKLAPEFARKVLDGDNDDERLAAIIESARERQIPLIAEQIENANSMARLWQAGVNYVQGHFIQEPDTEALAHTEQFSG